MEKTRLRSSVFAATHDLTDKIVEKFRDRDKKNWVGGGTPQSATVWAGRWALTEQGSSDSPW